MRRSLTSQAGLLTASRAVAQILNALTGFLVVRAFTQYDYGTYRQLLLLWTTLFMVGCGGFSQSLYQFIPGQRERARGYLGQACAAAATMALIWTVGLIALAGPAGRFFNNAELGGYMKLLAAFLACSVLTRVPEAALISLERVGALAVNTVCFESLKFVLVVAALLFHGGIAGVLWAMLAGTGLRLLHLTWILRSTGISWEGNFGVQFRYAMLLWLPGLLNIAGTYAHQYIVGYFFDPAQYAIYAVACFQVPFMGVLSSSGSEVLLVRAAEYHAEGRQAELLQIWHAASRKAMLIFIPVVVACAGLSGPFIETLFTARYRASAPLFIPIVLGLVFSGLFQDAMLRAYGAMSAYAGFYIVRIVLALLLGVAGARWLGLWGAAASTLLTLIIVDLWRLGKVAKLLEVPYSQVLPWRELGKFAAAASVSAALAAPVARLFVRPLAGLCAGAAVFGVAFIAFALWGSFLRPEESDAILGQLRGGFSRAGIFRSKVTAQ